jgi:hypothetical protein
MAGTDLPINMELDAILAHLDLVSISPYAPNAPPTTEISVVVKATIREFIK